MNILHDLRFALRSLAKSPGFTAAAIVAMLLGIGSNTAMFSVVDAVLLRPLPYASPDRLVEVFETAPKFNRNELPLSGPNLQDFRSENHVFEDMAVVRDEPFDLIAGGRADQFPGEFVSSNFFSLLGVKPALGRDFLPYKDHSNDARVVILSHGLWKSRFGSDPNIIGRSISMNGATFTIVGVLGPDFRPFYAGPELWVPVSMDGSDPFRTPTPITAQDIRNRQRHLFPTFARLKSGVTIKQAEANVEVIAAGLSQKYPDTNPSLSARVVLLSDQIIGPVRSALLVLLGAVAFVLLIACVNVANLLIVRATVRRKEVAIRVALGAGRARIVSQFLAESLALSVTGGALGLIASTLSVKALLALIQDAVPRQESVGLNLSVLAFTLGLCLLTAVAFGLAPALLVERKMNLTETLKEGGRGSGSRSRGRQVRNLFVTIQVALALVLLIGAGLMIKSFRRLTEVDPGFNPNNVLTVDVVLPRVKYSAEDKVRTFARESLERIRTVPGVESASLTTALPLSGEVGTLKFVINGRPPLPPGEIQVADNESVAPDYFRSMGIRLLEGRGFTASDNENAPGVVIINQSMARHFWPNQSPIGDKLTIDYGPAISRQIVGVVSDVRRWTLNSEPSDAMYVPFPQMPFTFMTFVARTDSDPRAVVSAVRGELNAIDNEQPLTDVQPMTDVVAASISQSRFSLLLLAIFAGIALLLAAVGIYGVTSYSVTERTQEVGIRMALGANKSDVIKMVIGQGMMYAAGGVLAGLLGSLVLTRVMSSLLYGVGDRDPMVFLPVCLLLLMIALVANYLPARKAVKVDPVTALRYQ